jgi:hypothetical protein
MGQLCLGEKGGGGEGGGERENKYELDKILGTPVKNSSLPFFLSFSSQAC